MRGTTYKWPLIILLSGFLIRTIGILMRIVHWRGNDYILITGTAIMAAGIGFLLVRLVLLKNK